VFDAVQHGEPGEDLPTQPEHDDLATTGPVRKPTGGLNSVVSARVAARAGVAVLLADVPPAEDVGLHDPGTHGLLVVPSGKLPEILARLSPAQGPAVPEPTPDGARLGPWTNAGER
jgi:hypothetical protein